MPILVGQFLRKVVEGLRRAKDPEEIELIAHANPRHTVDRGHYAGLGPLPEAVNTLAARLLEVHEAGDARAAAATQSLAEQKRWLEAILGDLTEGVVVCNMNHQVLLYNQVALKLLQVAGELGLGRSLFNLVTRQPILHAIELLTFRPHPADPGRCRMEMRLLVPPLAASGMAPERYEHVWDKNWQILLAVLHQEDFPLLRASQQGLESADAAGMLLGRNEMVNQIFHRELRALLEAK